MKKISLLVGIIMLSLIITGCSGVGRHNFTVKDSYVLQTKPSIIIGIVKKSKTVAPNAHVEQKLKDAVNTELKIQGLLSNDKDSANLTLELKILQYSEGNAFERWATTGGYGETSLAVTAKLKEGEKVVGRAMATRTVSSAVGLATVDASDYIFNDLAKDLISDLKNALLEAKDNN